VTLNGWQRLWCLMASLWAVFVVGLAALLQSNRGDAIPLLDAIGWVVVFWGVPAAGVYTLGLGIAWVRRGFYR